MDRLRFLNLLAIPFVFFAAIIFSDTVWALTVEEAKKADEIHYQDMLAGRVHDKTTLVSSTYVGGIVDAIVRSEELANNIDRANCVKNWFYQGGGGPDQISQVFNNPRFFRFPVYDVVVSLGQRACPVAAK